MKRTGGIAGIAFIILALNGPALGQNGWTDDGSVVRLTTSTDKVGIGTTNPGEKLVVSDASKAAISFNRGSASGQMEQSSSGGAFRLQNTTGSTKIQFRTYGDSYFNGGNVGIGTTIPGEKLEIVENANAVRYLRYKNQKAGTEVGAGVWVETDGNDVFMRAYGDNHKAWPDGSEIGTFAGSYLAIYVGNEKMRINSNGNVGIGTENPGSYKLAVNGKIRAKEVVVETGWSDFVFEVDYDLMPLNDVETFIKANQHLPDIPSAAEVEENGLSLGESQALLLLKIEELTLYVIELDKENKALKDSYERITGQLSGQIKSIDK